jgi:hypothetical protein
LFGDLVTEIAIRTDSGKGLLSSYSSVEFTGPVYTPVTISRRSHA